jgi:hypothetical protein
MAAFIGVLIVGVILTLACQAIFFIIIDGLTIRIRVKLLIICFGLIYVNVVSYFFSHFR